MANDSDLNIGNNIRMRDTQFVSMFWLKTLGNQVKCILPCILLEHVGDINLYFDTKHDLTHGKKRDNVYVRCFGPNVWNIMCSKLPNKAIYVQFYWKPSEMFWVKILYMYYSMLSATAHSRQEWMLLVKILSKTFDGHFIWFSKVFRQNIPKNCVSLILMLFPMFRPKSLVIACSEQTAVNIKSLHNP